MSPLALFLSLLFGLLAGPAAVLASAPPSRAEVESALRSNNPEQLAQTLKKLNQASGDPFELNFQRGLIHLKREQYDAAMASFSVIPVASARYLDARNNMAAIHVVQGKFAEAKTVLDEALKSSPTLELMHKNLNNLKAHLASKNYASALQVLEPGKNSKLTLVVSTGGLAPELPRPSKDAKDGGSAAAKPAASAAEPAAKTPEPVAAKPAPAASAVAAAPSAQERKPAAKPEPAAPLSAEDAELTRAAVQALQDWAQAWEKKDMERYLKAYAPDFTPGDGKSHAQWVKDRQARILSKGSIKIQLRQIEPTLVGKTQVKLRYRQLYQSDQLKVSSDKTIEMRWIGQQWLITSERASEGARK